MKVIFCGYRDWDNYESILAMVKTLIENYGDVIIVEGESSGADILARRAAIECGIPFRGYPAKSNEDSAGWKRNQLMIDQEHPDMCIAFHPFIAKSKWTKDMVLRARKAKIETYIIEE